MKYVIALLAASALTAGAALAGHQHGKTEGGMSEGGMSGCMMKMDAKADAHFKEVDANADGKITEKELVNFVTAKAKAEFAAMSGGDRAATLDEVKAYHKSKHRKMMKEMMGDGDSDADAEAPEEHEGGGEH